MELILLSFIPSLSSNKVGLHHFSVAQIVHITSQQVFFHMLPPKAKQACTLLKHPRGSQLWKQSLLLFQTFPRIKVPTSSEVPRIKGPLLHKLLKDYTNSFKKQGALMVNTSSEVPRITGPLLLSQGPWSNPLPHLKGKQATILPPYMLAQMFHINTSNILEVYIQAQHMSIYLTKPLAHLPLTNTIFLDMKMKINKFTINMMCQSNNPCL